MVQRYRGTFPEDEAVSSTLVLLPIGFFALLLLCSKIFFSQDLISCGHHSMKLNNYESCEAQTCDMYGMAEHRFTIDYCFTRMTHVEVDLTNGELGKSESLLRYKLFPYYIFSVGVLGLMVHFMWAVTDHIRKRQVIFITDGLTNAMDKLIMTVHSVSNDPNNNSVTTAKGLLQAVNTSWSNAKYKEFYRELKHILHSRTQQRRLCYNIIACRIVTFLVVLCIIAMLMFIYVIDFIRMLGGSDISQFNCQLPEAYYYYDSELANATLWKTTLCSVKSFQAYNVIAVMMIAIYIGTFVVYLGTVIRTGIHWKEATLLLDFMPLHDAPNEGPFGPSDQVDNSWQTILETSKKATLCDLQLIMALMAVNETTTNSIRLAKEIIVGLADKTRQEFLVALMHVVNWSKTPIDRFSGEGKIEEEGTL